VTLWFLPSEFNSLALSTKVVVVGFHVLSVALVVLLDRLLLGKWPDAKLSHRVATSSLKNKVEEGKGATNGQCEDYDVQKPFKEVAVRQELSGKVRDTTGGVALYRSPDNSRGNQGQHKSPVHANGIIGRLKRLVNQ